MLSCFVINVHATSVDEIRITSETYYVEGGNLPHYSATTSTAHASIEEYGSNTNWLKWGTGYSSWTGFGLETPTAEMDGETHYALRLKVDLDDGYSFTNSTKIYFNGAEWDLGHTTINAYEWGGYVIIDLGIAMPEPQFIVVYDFNGGTKDGKGTYVNQQVGYAPYITADNFIDYMEVEAPAGKELDAIEINGTRYELGTGYMLNQNTTYRYIWKSTGTSTKINDVNITIKAPKVGTKIVDETTKPEIVLGSNANYTVSWTMYVDNYPSLDESYEEGKVFGSTVEDGKWYFLEVYLMPKEGYIFDEESKVSLKVNGGTEYEIGYCSDNQYAFFTKVKATKEAPVYEFKNETKETPSFSKDEVAVFSIAADYSLFENGGAVYVDDKLVDPKYYTSESGSTVIKLSKEYMNTLGDGEHTLKVTFNDGGSATTSFEVAKTAQTTNTTNATTANPKTLDDITLWSTLFVISLAGIGLGFCRYKKIYSK